jgi:repressor LexA
MGDKSSLTDRQQAVLDFVLDQQRQHGRYPTLREICAHFGFASPFAATRHLQALEAKGALQRIVGKARAFLPPGPRFRRPTLLDIPLYGTIPAGSPTAAEQEPDSHVSVDANSLGLRPNGRVFALRVRGDSMQDAAILDGDIVFLTPREPRPRDIVAALIDGESTLKRYLVQRGRPFLRAENPKYPDLLPATELVIQGVMVGLLRRHHAT